MIGNHSRGDADETLERRGFLRTAVAVGGGALGVGATTAGVASGQDGTITTDAALPSDAPTLGNPDYTGVFVHLGGRSEDTTTEGVGTCPFVEDADRVAAYDVVLVDRETADTPQANSRLFSRSDDDAVEPGGLFIITDQQSCGDGPVQVALERVGAAEINTAQVGIESEVADGGAETAADGPGFGVGAAVAGLVGAGELLRRRG